MSLLSRIGVAFYMVVLLIIGCVSLLFELHYIDLVEVSDLLKLAYLDPQWRAVAMFKSVAVLVLNFIFWRSLVGGEQRDSMIAFDNPAGRVNVSLGALEDLVRRVVSQVPEVKDVRTLLKAGKKGLVVRARIVLNLDVNIPEMTSRLQELVRRKIQDTIGIEEPVTVRIDVTKIIPSGKRAKAKDKSDEGAPASEKAVPFEGYRA